MRRFVPLSGNIVSREDPMPNRVRLFFSILTVVFFFIDVSSGRPSRSQG